MSSSDFRLMTPYDGGVFEQPVEGLVPPEPATEVPPVAPILSPPSSYVPLFF